jgi:hypothetical protein
MHELNNLITTAIGSIESARAEPVHARRNEWLEEASWAAHAADRLTRQMVSSARPGNWADLDLSDSMGEVDQALDR